MKKFRGTFFLLAVALLVGGYIYFFERGPVKKKEEKKQKVFDNFVADDIHEVRIENLGTTLAAQKAPIDLQKDGKDVWQIVSPRKLKADENIVRSMLSGVGDFNPDVTIDNPPNLADYGLNSPTARCTLKTKSGASFVLLIGDKGMGGTSSYVKPADKNSVYLVASYAADNLKKTLNDYRDHSFFKTDTVLAKKVRVTRDGKTVAFEKDKDNNWNMVAPVKSRADASKIRDLLNTISSLRVEEFANDHPTGLSEYGLVSPRIQVEIWPSDGGASRAIQVGRKKAKTTNLFAKDRDFPYVYLVGEYFDKSMDLKPSDYRDKTILQFDGSAVKTLNLKHGSKTVIYQKDDKGQWVSPGRGVAAMEATALVNQLCSMIISDFTQPGPETGLASPPFTVEASLTDGSHRLFKFGTRGNGKVYLTMNKSKDVYLVPDAVVTQMEGYYNTILTPVPIASPTASK